jgi:hypothetical protein
MSDHEDESGEERRAIQSLQSSKRRREIVHPPPSPSSSTQIRSSILGQARNGTQSLRCPRCNRFYIKSAHVTVSNTEGTSVRIEQSPIYGLQSDTRSRGDTKGVATREATTVKTSIRLVCNDMKCGAPFNLVIEQSNLNVNLYTVDIGQ